MNAINLGNLYIPVIVPQKGKDYYTETEKEEFITEITNSINEIVEPQEETRQENETARFNAEAIRQIKENSRIVSEESRLSAEETRESNETARQTAETTRNATFQAEMQSVENAIGQIEDLTESYNQNAEQKTRTFNSNANSQTSSFNSNYDTKLSNFNSNYNTKLSEFNSNAVSKTEEFDSHTQEIQNRLSSLETARHTHSNKSILDNTTASFTTEEKTKLAGLVNYDDTEIQERVEILENTVNSELEDATATGESINVTDSANAPAKLLPSGNTYQVQYEGYNLVDVQNMTISGGSSQSTILKVPIDANTDYYYYDVRNYSTTFNWGYIEEYDSEDNLTQTIRATANQRMDLTFLTGLNASYLKISSPVKYDSIIENPLENNIMLTKGTIKKALEPFVGEQLSPSPKYPQQIHVVKGHNEFKIANSDDTEFQTLELDLPEGMEMCKISDYADTFEKQDGKWYKNTIIGDYLFTGNENIQKTDDVFYTDDIGDNILTSGIICLSNRMKGVSNTNTGSTLLTDTCCFRINSYSRFYFNMSSITTDIDTIKQYLTENETHVKYIRNAITPIEITDQTLISQLDAMQKVLSYYGGTNITTITAEDLNPILNFDYKKSNRLRIEAIEEKINSIQGG